MSGNTLARVTAGAPAYLRDYAAHQGTVVAAVPEGIAAAAVAVGRWWWTAKAKERGWSAWELRLAGLGVRALILTVVAWLIVALAARAPLWVTVPGVIGLVLAVGELGLRTQGVTRTVGDANVRKLRDLIAGTLPAKVLATNPDALDVRRLKGDHHAAVYGITVPPITDWKAVAKLNIAGALGVQADQVTVTQGANPCIAHIRVATVSPSQLPPPPWQLANADRNDLTRPVPIGENLDGQAPVGLQLFSRDSDGDLQAHHAIVFGETGSGKSNLTRLLVLAAIMDRSATVCVAQKEGSKDFRGLRGSLDWLGDITDREGVRAMLQRAVDHMRQVRAGKVPEAPYLVVLEEAQNVLSGRKQLADPDIVRLTRTLLAEARDAAICLVIVTQRPVSGSLDQEIAQRPPNRLAFTVNGNTDAEMAMGAKLNDQNTPMKAPRYAVGVHINGDLDARVLVPKVNGTEAARIANAHPREKLHDAQEPAGGPFPTYQPGPRLHVVQDPEPPAESILDHCRQVWPPTLDRIAADHLVTLLPVASPAYDGWVTADLRKALRGHGIEINGIKIGGKSTQGLYLRQLEQAEGGVSVTA